MSEVLLAVDMRALVDVRAEEETQGVDDGWVEAVVVGG